MFSYVTVVSDMNISNAHVEAESLLNKVDQNSVSNFLVILLCFSSPTFLLFFLQSLLFFLQHYEIDSRSREFHSSHTIKLSSRSGTIIT